MQFSRKMKQRWFPVGLALMALLGLAFPVNAGSSKDIVETAVSAGNFNTLASALKAGDLVITLKGEGPFTVFAPTDAAFAKLPEGTLSALLKDKEQLRAVLTYHVVPGKVMAAEVLKIDSAKTVNGKSFKVSKAEGSVKVDDAQVIQTDIVASNGVIHVIDTVLIPPKN